MIQKFAPEGRTFPQPHRPPEQSRAADPAHDRQGHEHPRDRAFAEFSIKTVESHRQRIKRKLNLTTALSWFNTR